MHVLPSCSAITMALTENVCDCLELCSAHTSLSVRFRCVWAQVERNTRCPVNHNSSELCMTVMCTSPVWPSQRPVPSYDEGDSTALEDVMIAFMSAAFDELYTAPVEAAGASAIAAKRTHFTLPY
jgi:hypothetical protein